MLSRKCLQELLRYRPARVTMHTRSHLILEDLDLLQRFGTTLEVGVSITTHDESIARQFEPRAPSIRRRLLILSVRYRRFFEPDNYERARQFISSRLSSRRRLERPGEPAPLPERFAQPKLAI